MIDYSIDLRKKIYDRYPNGGVFSIQVVDTYALKKDKEEEESRLAKNNPVSKLPDFRYPIE